mgnify:CR=1 FL=1
MRKQVALMAKRRRTGETLERMKMLKAYSAAQGARTSERMKELAITIK